MAAFERIYTKFRVPIFTYVLQMLPTRAAAEEVAQEVFLRVYRNRDSYRENARFSTWLWTIARNAAIDELRKKTENPLAQDGDPEADHPPSPLDRLAATGEDAEAQLIEQADRRRLEECLAGLTDPQRDALHLRTVAELSYDEIAQMLKLSLAALKSIIHRAKQGLIECLKAGGSNEPA